MNGFTSDRYQAEYWLQPIPRREAQRVFDEYTAVLVQIQERQLKIDMAVGYLATRAGVAPGEFQTYLEAKMAEFKKAQEAKITEATADLVDATRVILG